MAGVDVPATMPAVGAQPGGAASVLAGANPYGQAASAAADVLKSTLSSPGASSGSDGSISDRSGKSKNVINTHQRNVDRSVNFGARTSGSQSNDASTSAKTSAAGGAGGDTRGKPPEDGKKSDASKQGGVPSFGGIPPLVLAAFATLGIVAAYLIGRR